MKNCFKILFLALFALQGFAQKIPVEIDLTPYANRIKALEMRVDAIEAGSVISPPSKLEDCKPNPTISGEITNITSRGLTFKFDAVGLTNMKYMITGSKVYIDSIKPTGNTINVVFPTVFPNGNYTLSIEGLNCKGGNSRLFTIAGGVDPPSSAKCDYQPTFFIKGFTNQAATIEFDARNLTDLTLSLVQGEKIIKQTAYHPDVNTLYFPFGSIQPAGNYKIVLTPVSCTTDAIPAQQITIKKEETGGVVDPPVVTDPGGVEYKRITKGMDEHMNITRRLVGDVEYITDNTANSLQPNYKYHYVIGSTVVTQSTPLKDFPYARNNGFRVVKFNKKDGVQSMNEWPGQGETPEPGGYYKADAGQSFVYNVSAAVETGFYTGSQSGFINHIPANYNPALEMPQWADIMPDLKLPKGHMFVLSRSDWPIDQMFRKGVTHIRHHEIPRPNGDETLAFQMRLAGETYNDVPISTTIFGGIPNNPSDEQVKQMIARHAYPDALWIGETMEQSHAIDPSKRWLYEFNKGITENQKKNFLDKGIPAYHCFNYFQFWPESYHLGQVSAERSKAMFRMPLAELPYTNFSPGAPLSPTNLIVEAVYLGAPDIQQTQAFDLAYRLSLIKHMGYEAGVFLAGEHEWRPNNMFLAVYPDGKFYGKGKIPLDPNTLITSTFFSQVFGKVFVQWGGTGKLNEGRILNRFTFEPTYWLKNGWTDYRTSTANPNYDGCQGCKNGDVFPYQTTIDFPHMRTGGIGYYGYNGGTDLCRFALQVYADTWGQLDDGERQFLSYRIDGGDWIEVTNFEVDDIIESRHKSIGITYSIRKNGRIAWFYVNPFADTVWHDLEVKFPNGRVVKNRVAGNGIHAKIENL